MKPDDARTCPACGGTELSWGSTIRGPTGVSQGRHHTGELAVQVFLGCSCGETIEVHDLDEFLGGVEPARRRMTRHLHKEGACPT